MAWGITTRHLSSLNSYAQALKHFNDTAPFRGSTHRPLGNRREKHKSLYMRNDGTEAIAMRLYQTDLATFFPDGTAKLEVYDSAASSAFIHYYLPPGVTVTSHQSKMGFSTKVGGGEFLRPVTGTLDFKDGRLLNPENVQRFERSFIDRKASAQVRKLLAPFDHWAKILLKLKGGRMDHDRQQEQLNQRDFARLLERDVIPEANYLQLLNSSHTSWHGITADTLLEIREMAYKAADVYLSEPLPFGATPQKARN